MSESIWSKLNRFLFGSPEQRENWEQARRAREAEKAKRQAIPISNRYLARYVSGFPVGKTGQEVNLGITDRALLVWREGWSREIALKRLRTARLETGERLTAMRIITTGPIGFFWKKKDKFLVLEWDDPSGLNVPVILSFNGASEALARIQQARIHQRSSE